MAWVNGRWETRCTLCTKIGRWLADETDSSRAIWRLVTKGLRKQRIVLAPANCCIIHAFLARSGRKPCPAPGLLFSSLRSLSFSFTFFLMKPQFFFFSFLPSKIHFVPVGCFRRTINAPAAYGEGYLDYELETRRPSSWKLVPFLVPEDCVKNLTGIPTRLYRVFIEVLCIGYTREKKESSVVFYGAVGC